MWKLGHSVNPKDTKMVLGGRSRSWWKLAFLLSRAARAEHSAVVPWLYHVHTVKTQGKKSEIEPTKIQKKNLSYFFQVLCK